MVQARGRGSGHAGALLSVAWPCLCLLIWEGGPRPEPSQAGRQCWGGAGCRLSARCLGDNACSVCSCPISPRGLHLSGRMWGRCSHGGPPGKPLRFSLPVAPSSRQMCNGKMLRCPAPVQQVSWVDRDTGTIMSSPGRPQARGWGDLPHHGPWGLPTFNSIRANTRVC